MRYVGERTYGQWARFTRVPMFELAHSLTTATTATTVTPATTASISASTSASASTAALHHPVVGGHDLSDLEAWHTRGRSGIPLVTWGVVG